MKVVWPEVREEAVGHTTEACAGHVEAFELDSDPDVTSERRRMIFRRVMCNIDCRWFTAGMCS